MGALDPAHVTYCPSLQPGSSVLGAEGGWGLAGLLFLLPVGPSVFFFLMWTIFKVFIEFVTILFLVFMCVCFFFFFCLFVFL